MFNKHAKFHEKIRSLTHKTRNLCLQGKRDPVAAKAGHANQAYIGGGPWPVRPSRGRPTVLWPARLQPGTQEKPFLQEILANFKFFNIKSNIFQIKIKFWINFLEIFHLLAHVCAPICLVALCCSSCLARRNRRCCMLPFACVPWHCGVWYVLRCWILLSWGRMSGIAIVCVCWLYAFAWNGEHHNPSHFSSCAFGVCLCVPVCLAYKMVNKWPVRFEPSHTISWCCGGFWSDACVPF